MLSVGTWLAPLEAPTTSVVPLEGKSDGATWVGVGPDDEVGVSEGVSSVSDEEEAEVAVGRAGAGLLVLVSTEEAVCEVWTPLVTVTDGEVSVWEAGAPLELETELGEATVVPLPVLPISKCDVFEQTVKIHSLEKVGGVGSAAMTLEGWAGAVTWVGTVDTVTLASPAFSARALCTRP